LPRAKRTDRAEARRRYRATIADPLDDRDIDDDDEESAPEPSRSGIRSRAAAATAATATAATKPARSGANLPQRPGIMSALRSSFRPLDLRGDLQALPRLVRTPAFLAPVALSGLSVALVPLVGRSALTDTLYQYFSFTAPLGTAFVAGFFAPRASYLLGALAALASVGFQALAFSNGSFGGTLVGAVDVNNHPIAPRDLANSILSQALFVGVPWCAFFASAAAWYRRFLRNASPGRQSGPRNTPRRPDGRVAKRNEGRPMLARRR
jgi:hypothetical protein